KSVTLSLTDLSKVGKLIEAYDTFGSECLYEAIKDPGFFSQFARAAYSSENYGGNTKEQGYTNMVDLGDLAKLTSNTLASSVYVLSALDECVIYQVRGQYRVMANGLSCYYSYNGDIDDFIAYAPLGAGTAFKYYFSYGLTGELDENGMAYIAEKGFTALPKIQNLTTLDWDGAPLDLDEEGTAYLYLGPDAQDILAGIGFQLFYVDEENDFIMLLGSDNDIIADWDNGVFLDNFRGVWGAIDGCLVYMELKTEGADYNLYSVPILLNGEEYNLQVVYDFTYQVWSILGAWKGIDEKGMADKELRLLQEGDEIITLWKLATFSGDDDFVTYPIETLTVTADTSFTEVTLFDGTYRMVFEMWDAMGNYAYSDPVQFDCVDGMIITTVFED
ncbi:MAG: clostripain, partial [Clostridiaceae bacterium]|nr:clostripain [Clostridiaceae bacterium]